VREPSMAECEQVTAPDKSLLIRGPFAGAMSVALLQEREKAIQRRVRRAHCVEPNSLAAFNSDASSPPGPASPHDLTV